MPDLNLPQLTVNERLVSLEIVRQILLLRYSLYVRNLVVEALNNTEQPVASSIRDMLHTDAGFRDASQVRKLDALIDQINALRKPAWQESMSIVETHFTALAESEPVDQKDIFSFLLPGVSLLLPTMVGIGALAQKFNGRLLRTWVDDAQQAEAQRIRSVIYASIAAGDTPDTVARKVVGSAAMLGRDGTTQISRNYVDTIVRSGAVHFSAYARDQFYRANTASRYTDSILASLPDVPVPRIDGIDDAAVLEARRQVRQALSAQDADKGLGKGGTLLFLVEQYVAVLDSRTTKLCAGLDGNLYPVGEGPIPPLHPNCRSNRLMVLPKSLAGPTYNPDSYISWFRKQPSEVRSMILGKTKANKSNEQDLADALFRDYGARPMTLLEVREEMRRIMAAY